MFHISILFFETKHLFKIQINFNYFYVFFKYFLSYLMIKILIFKVLVPFIIS